MDHYHIWCNLKDGARDVEFCGAARAYLGYLQEQGLICGFSITRCKLGFRPPGLGEFHVDIRTQDLAQLEQAFQLAATRSGEVERLHAGVYSRVKDLTFALYRDFPDPCRSVDPG